ncbi:MAG: hypothetical protein KGM17_03015 [Sphingomonadales bacterium]|nr:hypothetical protein [Sphingomonadales bacterium]
MALPPTRDFRRGESAGGLRGLFGWRPIQALLVIALLVLATPAVRSALDPFAVEQVPGGIVIDTGGAEGRIAGGQFRLDLPLAVANRTENMIMRVELWTDAWACPEASTPTAQCRRLLSTGQDFATKLGPGGSLSLPTVLTGGAPEGVRDDAAVRIERRLANIYDDRDAKRSAAIAAMH